MQPNPFMTIFGRDIYWYGVMIAIGILACFAVLFIYGKQIKASPKLLDFSFYTAIGSIAFGFGAAALWQSLYNFLENPEAGFEFTTSITAVGGIVSGALFFLFVYFVFYRRLSKERLVDIMPVAPCCILIAHAFGRVGCFFAGCCYGKVGESAFSLHFPERLEPSYRPAFDALPTQLWEAIFLFVLFAALSVALLRFKFRLTMPVYMFAYGVFRFIIEFFRGDHRGELFGVLSPTQYWCILIVIVSIPFYILLRRTYKKMDAQAASAPENPAVSADVVPETAGEAELPSEVTAAPAPEKNAPTEDTAKESANQ